MRTIAISEFFRTSNYLEAILWGVIAVGFAITAVRRPARFALWVAAIAFAAFGVSDVVETRTGAWWRPWWLLVWKGVCVVTFLVLLVLYGREQRHKRKTASVSH